MGPDHVLYVTCFLACQDLTNEMLYISTRIKVLTAKYFLVAHIVIMSLNAKFCPD